MLQLPHRHPGGGLHGLLAEEGLGGQVGLRRRTGLLPLLLGLPPEAVRRLRQREGVAEVAAIDQQLQLQAHGLLGLLHLQGRNARTVALHRQQLHRRPPLQQRFPLAPAAQDCLRRRRPVAEAAHPVVVESAGFLLLQLPQEGAPKTRLPGGELIAVGTADPSSTDHPPQPGPRGEQQRGRTATG